MLLDRSIIFSRILVLEVIFFLYQPKVSLHDSSKWNCTREKICDKIYRVVIITIFVYFIMRCNQEPN